MKPDSRKSRLGMVAAAVLIAVVSASTAVGIEITHVKYLRGRDLTSGLVHAVVQLSGPETVAQVYYNSLPLLGQEKDGINSLWTRVLPMSNNRKFVKIRPRLKAREWVEIVVENGDGQRARRAIRVASPAFQVQRVALSEDLAHGVLIVRNGRGAAQLDQANTRLFVEGRETRCNVPDISLSSYEECPVFFSLISPLPSNKYAVFQIETGRQSSFMISKTIPGFSIVSNEVESFRTTMGEKFVDLVACPTHKYQERRRGVLASIRSGGDVESDNVSVARICHDHFMDGLTTYAGIADIAAFNPMMLIDDLRPGTNLSPYLERYRCLVSKARALVPDGGVELIIPLVNTKPMLAEDAMTMEHLENLLFLGVTLGV